MAKKRRSPEELRQVLEHLQYEIDMLVAVARGLSSGVAFPSSLNNAMVESFAIHARNLIDFLWPANPSNDWVVARDFFANEDDWQQFTSEVPETLRQARIRAHKEIAHLTYGRLRVTPDAKPWPFSEIVDQLLKALGVFQQSVAVENVDADANERGEAANG